MRSRAVAWNWPQVRLRNCSFAPNWAVLLGSQSLWKTLGTTFLFLKTGLKSHCLTVVLFEIGRHFLTSQHLFKTPCVTVLLLEIGLKSHCATVVLLKLGRIVRKLNPVRNSLRNCPVNRKWCLLLKSYNLTKKTVRNCPAARKWRQNTLRNRRFPSNWPPLLGSQSLRKTPGTTFLFLEINIKSNCANAVFFQIGPYC